MPTETLSVANAQRLTRRLWGEWRVGWSAVMKDQTSRRSLRSVICTRVSTEQVLEQDFNSLDAQRAACEAYPPIYAFFSLLRYARPSSWIRTDGVTACACLWPLRTRSERPSSTAGGAVRRPRLKRKAGARDGGVGGSVTSYEDRDSDRKDRLS